jgi:hypothetical protein
MLLPAEPNEVGTLRTILGGFRTTGLKGYQWPLEMQIDQHGDSPRHPCISWRVEDVLDDLLKRARQQVRGGDGREAEQDLVVR